MKKGDKVICINNYGIEDKLTLYKQYTISISPNGNANKITAVVYIYTDTGGELGVFAHRFEKSRKLKLKRILNIPLIYFPEEWFVDITRKIKLERILK